MPELPEVETVRRGLEPALVGRVLTRVEIRRPDLRQPFPPRFVQRIQGCTVRRLERRAKYLLLWLVRPEEMPAPEHAGGQEPLVLLVHLGMSGRMQVFPAPPDPPGRHDHVLFQTDAGTVVVFNDPRRFGMMDLFPAAALPSHPRLVGLGPEPLAATFQGPELLARLAGRRSPLKTTLLDQRVVAGLGNIYVSESLFRAGLSPFRSAASLTADEAARLAGAIRAVLEEAIAAGGSSLRDHLQTNGELGYFQHAFAVYDRAGHPCPGCTCAPAAGGGILRVAQAGRATFYCPHRQG